jgi:hypothetical protein
MTANLESKSDDGVNVTLTFLQVALFAALCYVTASHVEGRWTSARLNETSDR